MASVFGSDSKATAQLLTLYKTCEGRWGEISAGEEDRTGFEFSAEGHMCFITGRHSWKSTPNSLLFSVFLYWITHFWAAKWIIIIYYAHLTMYNAI